MIPKYMQIAHYIEDLILSRKINAGGKLPSENELANKFNTTRMTVRRALLELEKKGIISRVPGVGTFVTEVNVISSKRIGVLVHNQPIVYGIVKFCTSVGSKCFVLDYGYGLEQEKKALSELLKMGIDGLIMEPHAFSSADEILSGLISEGFPVVFVDRARTGDEITPAVVSDNYEGGKLLGQHMKKVHGVEKTLFVTQEELSITSVRDRFNGIKDALNKSPDILRFPSLDSDFSELVERVKKNKYDAIFFCNDYLAIRGLSFLQRAGIKIPEDILATGFDDAHVSAFFHPRLTTVKQDLKKIGEMAAALLVEIIRGERITGIKKVRVELLVRESCGCGK